MSKLKIAGVVTLYNPSKENFDNITRYIDSLDKLYVVDNTEGKSNEKKIPKSKKIEYIFKNENLGVATALNIGATKAIEAGYKWMLTMDQDSKMTNELIDSMLDFISNTKEKNIGLVSPYQSINKEDEKTDKEYEDVIEIMTSGNIINLDAYKKIGGFKDWLFIDCVDTEYCLNLHVNGYKVLRLNNLKMKHDLGELVVHKLFGKEYPCYNHNPLRRYYIVRNNLYMRELYGNDFKEYCDHLIRIQKGQVKRIIAFEKNKIKKLKMMYKGYKDFKKKVKGKIK